MDSEILVTVFYKVMEALPGNPEQAEALLGAARNVVKGVPHAALEDAWLRDKLDDVVSYLPRNRNDKLAVLSLASQCVEKVVRPYLSSSISSAAAAAAASRSSRKRTGKPSTLPRKSQSQVRSGKPALSMSRT